jgi:hypothetical protein
MKKLGVTVLLAFGCLLMAGSFAPAQESILDRLAALESNQANINSIMATQARMKADIENVATDVKALREELTALRKAVAPNATFTPSTDHTGWDAKAASFTSSPAASSWGSSAPAATQGDVARLRLFRRSARSCSASG